MRTMALIAAVLCSAPVAGAVEVTFDLRIPRPMPWRGPRERPFTVKFVGRAPGMAYRLEVEAPGRKVETFHILPVPALTAVGDTGATCDALRTRITELSAQTLEPRATQQTLQLADAAEQAPGCPGLRVVASAMRHFTEFRIQRTFVLGEGQRLRLRVERIDAQPSGRAWDFTVEAPSRPAGLPWPAATEEEWLVGETARDVVEMALYAVGRLPPDPQGLGWAATRIDSPTGDTYSVTFRPAGDAPPVVQRVRVDPDVWAAAVYQPLAESILRSAGASARPGSGGPGTPLASLQDLRAAVIARESARLSGRLGKGMLDPAIHEQAALVRGAFALREASGSFQDTRHSLSRMAAHLAVARALRGGGPASFEGRLAEDIVDTLALQQTDALTQLEGLEIAARSAAERAWVATLVVRNTGDWRGLQRPAAAPLLQRLEHMRAVQDRRGSERAFEFLQQARPAPLADWARIAMNAGATVGVGNALAPSLMPLELAELAEVWALRTGGTPDVDAALASLNATPGRCLQVHAGASRPEVIDGGAWAAFHQRHLLASAWAMEKHLGDMLGLKKEAVSWQQEVEKRLGHLTLFPLLRNLWHRETEGSETLAAGMKREQAACVATAQVQRSRPELLSAANWVEVESRCGRALQNEAFVDPGIWFTTGPPRGTAHDPYRTMLTSLAEVTVPALTRLRRLAPYNRYLLSSYVRVRHGEKPTPRAYAAAAGSLVDYDMVVQAKWLELGGGPDAALRASALEACDKDAEVCLHAGRVLAERGLDDAAARAYERAWRSARDRVAVSHSATWLSQYYFDKEQEDQALAVAHAGAAVGSGAGLQALAMLLERLGRQDEAAKVYEAMADRYPSTATTDLLCFGLRRARRAGQGIEASATGDWRRLFPRGLQPTSAARPGLAATSARGGIAVAAMGLTEELQPLGVRGGDFVVGVDGLLVSLPEQYRCVLTFKDDPELSVTVVRHGQFLDMHGPYTRWRYGPRSAPEAGSSAR